MTWKKNLLTLKSVFYDNSLKMRPILDMESEIIFFQIFFSEFLSKFTFYILLYEKN